LDERLSTLAVADRAGRLAAVLLAAESRAVSVDRETLFEAAGIMLAEPDGAEAMLRVADGERDAADALLRQGARLSVDVDRDGQITQFDLARFLGGVGAADPAMDLNGDGQLDQNDIAEFVLRFQTLRGM